MIRDVGTVQVIALNAPTSLKKYDRDGTFTANCKLPPAMRHAAKPPADSPSFTVLLNAKNTVSVFFAARALYQSRCDGASEAKSQGGD